MRHIMTIMILNDDEPGTFGFDKRGHFVKVRSLLVSFISDCNEIRKHFVVLVYFLTILEDF